MLFAKSLRKWFSGNSTKRPLLKDRRPSRLALHIEHLEDRSVPATLDVTALGVGGWRADDVRSAAVASPFDLVGTTLTNAPKPGATPSAADDLAIVQQLQIVSGPAGSTYGGAIRFDGTTSNNGKTTYSVIDTAAGFAPASDLITAGFSAKYEWYGQPNPSSRTAAFRIGVQSTAWGTDSGESQNAFTPIRSGESAWDLILVHVPATTSDNAWRTENLSSSTGLWNLYRQAGNNNWVAIAGANTPNGAPDTAKTLADWAVDPNFGSLLFGAGAKVTSVQFGLGSSQSNSISYVDYLETSLLNGGDRIDFGAVQTVYVDQAAEYSLTFDADGSTTLTAGDTVTWNGAVPVAGLTFGVNAFGTIQSAINGVAVGGTVNVAAGTYAENVLITKGVTLRGAQFGVDATVAPGSRGAESVISSPLEFGVEVRANDVTIDGFEFTNYRRDAINVRPTNSAPGVSTRSNVLIQNNYIHLAEGPISQVNGIVLGESITNSIVTDTATISDVTISKNFIDVNDSGSARGIIMTRQFASIAYNSFEISSNTIRAKNNGLFASGTTTLYTIDGIEVLSNRFENTTTAINMGNLDAASKFNDNTFINNSVGAQLNFRQAGGEVLDNTFTNHTTVALSFFDATFFPQSSESPTITGNEFSNNLRHVGAPALAIDLDAIDADNTLHGSVRTSSLRNIYAKIQTAVTAATPGDIVTAQADLYPELVVINKSLTLRGAQFGVDARTGRAAPTDETIIDGTGLGGAVWVNGNGIAVTIDGFTIQNVTAGVGAELNSGITTVQSANLTGLTIVNNIIQSVPIGIVPQGDLAVIQRNLIQNTTTGPAGQTGIYTDFDLTNALIDSNKFANNANTAINVINLSGDGVGNIYSNNVMDSQIYLYGQISGSQVTGNVITNSASGGISLGGLNSGVSITNNEVLGVADGYSALRLRDDAGGPNDSLTITNNKFIGGATGFGVRPSSASYSGTLTLSANQISGGAAAIQNDDATLDIDASTNFWGTSSGAAVAATVLGDGAANVDISPLIDNDESSANQAVVGFQPDLSSLTATAQLNQTGSTGRVQEAVNVVLTGGTVHIEAGAYTDGVVTVPTNNLTVDVPTGATGFSFTLDGSIAAITLTGAGDVNVAGNASANTINGNAGQNRITGGGDNDVLDGGAGIDTAVYSGLRSAYTITFNVGSTTVSGPEGTDTLTNIENLEFSDQTVPVGTATTIALTTGTNPAVYGTSLEFTATIVNALNTSELTGSVDFYDGATLIISGAPLSGSGASRTAKLPISTLTVTGLPHTIKAVYVPTGGFTASEGTVEQTITQRQVTVTGITAFNKTYDGTITALLNLGGATPVNFVSGDAVALDTGTAVGAFLTRQAGTGKQVNITGLVLTGAAAGNYLLVQPTTTANIATKQVTVSGLTADNKTYDGTTSAVVHVDAAMLNGVITLSPGPGDFVNLSLSTVTGAFLDANAGTGKTVNISGISLAGADAANYTLAQPTATANIDKATPTATLAVNNSPQTYTGSGQAATVGITVSSVPGAVASILTGGAATQTNAGTYAVTASFVPTDTTNYNTLTGLPAGDFIIDKATPTATLAVSNSPQIYNGSGQAATVGITVSSVPGSVASILTGGAATQTDAGTYVVTANFVPTDTANYNTLTGLPAGNFIIDKATPTATLAVNNSPQTYNGSGQAATVGISVSSVPGTVASILTGGAATQTNAGTYAVTASFVPTDTTNYNTLTGLPAGDFVIDKKVLTVTGITANNKNFDGNTSATLNVGNAQLVGVIGGNAVSLNTSAAVGAFISAARGGPKTVFVTGLTLTGAAAANYSVTQPTTTATIFDDFILNGSGIDDTLVLTSDGVTGAVTYVLNNGAPVSLTGVRSFTFNGQDGKDSMKIVLPTFGLMLAGNAIFDGGPNGAVGDSLIVDSQFQQVRSALSTIHGRNQTDGVKQTITHSNVEGISLDNATNVNASFGPNTVDRNAAFAGLTADQRFVQALYLNVLGRAGSVAELDSWVAILTSDPNPAAGRAAVVNGIEGTPEARTRLVVSWYQTYLGRSIANNPSEGQNWINALMQGAAEEAVLGNILGTDEFFSRAQTLVTSGTANERYINTLFNVLLSRSPSPEDLASWLDRLASAGRTNVAIAFLVTDEFRIDQIEGYYNAIIRRPGEAAGLLGWANSGLDLATMRRMFEATPEFYEIG